MKEFARGVLIFITGVVIFCVVAYFCCGAEVTVPVSVEVELPIGVQLQNFSVNILSVSSLDGGTSCQGSGTIFITTVEDKPSAWVITAAHVVDNLREVSSGDESSDSKSVDKYIRYRDAQIIQEKVENGRAIGELKYDAKIINVDTNRDIALLRVRKGDFVSVGAKFYLSSEIPFVGTEIYHCGAPGGKNVGGTSSLTSGIISRIGVRITEFGGGSEYGIFDQTDTAALGGSSGGMIALKADGQWIGMITLGLGGGDNFHWFVPVRSVKDWAEEIKVMWLLDPSCARPTEDDVKNIILECHSDKKK